MIEVIYKNTHDGLRFRKGKTESISGVYIEFPTVETVMLDNSKVIFKGHGDEVQLAEWKKDDFLEVFSYTGETLISKRYSNF